MIKLYTCPLPRRTTARPSANLRNACYKIYSYKCQVGYFNDYYIDPR